LVRRPKILLLDEPLSALDHEMRFRLQEELLRVHKKFSLTTVLVSHDPSEIFRLCDFVYKIDGGRVVSKGTPSDLFLKGKISSGFRFAGEILKIERFEMLYFLTVAIGETVVNVTVSEGEIEGLRVGDRVQVVSNSFSPMIFKVDGI
jgi:molybdate transport system ATP-binding protein